MPNGISVIMACYNCEETLNKAIDSIIVQTYSDWVMICCDDGSTDNTYKILNEYKSKYPDKFVIIRNEQNKKLAYSLNRCLEYANTEFVARMDADDESLPERFEKQIQFLSEHPECIVCGAKIRFINDFSGREHVSNVDETPDRFTLHKHIPFNHATIMCRKAMYDVLDGYTDIKTTVRCEDKDLWYRFFSHGLAGKNLNEPLYIIHENEALVYRITPRNRWNIFITDIRGYRLLHYPWYWYYKPIVNLMKIFVPKRMVIWYFKRFRNK